MVAQMDLAGRARSGDGAWAAIRRQYWALACAVAFRRLGEGPAVEEAAEAAFAGLRLEPLADPVRSMPARVALAADAAAVALLYERYGRPARALALRLLGDPGAAEDAVQEAFAKLVADRDGAPVERPGGLVMRLVRNAVVDRVRHEQRKSSPTPHAHSLEALVEQAGDTLADRRQEPVEEQVERGEVEAAVRAALARLSAPHREIVALYYFAGLSLPEIAERLGEPVERLKKRLQVARAHLTRLLAPAAG